MTDIAERPRNIAFFVTCLADVIRPSVPKAAMKLLHAAGFRVSVPQTQTCCGQPAYNGGDAQTARALAERVIGTLIDYDAVVVPSASCAGMIRVHYPTLFPEGSTIHEAARTLAARTYELCSFLHRHKVPPLAGRWRHGAVAVHDSCALLREIHGNQAMRDLLDAIEGLKWVDLDDPETCCGFGGLFAVKLPEISAALADKRIETIVKNRAAVLTGADLGCLMHLAGRMHRRGIAVAVMHIAEILAGFSPVHTQNPADAHEAEQ